MTGAGFGGCTISIVKKEKVKEFEKYVGEAYVKKVGYVPSLLNFIMFVLKKWDVVDIKFTNSSHFLLFNKIVALMDKNEEVVKR